MLEALFVFLKDGPNEAKPARAYNKTGKYSKAGGKEVEPPEEEKKWMDSYMVCDLEKKLLCAILHVQKQPH